MTESPTAADRKDSGALAALGWAAFLGCSWTWVIGMFLPVLLVRDYGVWGWVAFAVPNVVGAAAMGWVLARPGSSERMAAEHRAACAGFSIITVAFHLFFAAWFVGGLSAFHFTIAAVGLGLIVGWLTVAVRRVDLALAAAVWVVSVVAFFTVLNSGGPRLAGGGETGAARPADVLWFVPVSVFGFLLCPYLDLSFHRARQSTTPAAARVAFGVGFGVVFLSMIVFSLCYSGWLEPVLRPGGAGAPPPDTVRLAIVAHMVVQIGFTIGLHGREWAAAHSRRPAAQGQGGDGPMGAAAYAALWLGALALGAFAHRLPAYRGLLGGEVVYRGFMAFYGLLFPAYAWLCMIPTRDGHSAPSRGKLTVLAAATLLAAPMYWMGFVERKVMWLAPGLLVVLFARYFLPRRKQVTPVA